MDKKLTLKEVFDLITDGTGKYPYDDISGIRKYKGGEDTCKWKVHDVDYDEPTTIKSVWYDEEMRIENSEIKKVSVLQVHDSEGCLTYEWDDNESAGWFGVMIDDTTIEMRDEANISYTTFVKKHE